MTLGFEVMIIVACAASILNMFLTAYAVDRIHQIQKKLREEK